MKNNQVKITFQDNEQTAVVQITQNGNEVSVSTKFTPELNMDDPNDTPALNWAAVFPVSYTHLYEPLLKRNRSAYLTFLNWARRRNETSLPRSNTRHPATTYHAKPTQHYDEF